MPVCLSHTHQGPLLQSFHLRSLDRECFRSVIDQALHRNAVEEFVQSTHCARCIEEYILIAIELMRFDGIDDAVDEFDISAVIVDRCESLLSLDDEHDGLVDVGSSDHGGGVVRISFQDGNDVIDTIAEAIIEHTLDFPRVRQTHDTLHTTSTYKQQSKYTSLVL